LLLKNILVAVDGSENSDRVLDFALGLSEKFGSAITILNASESLPMGAVPPEPTASLGNPISAISGDVTKIHDQILSKAVARAKAFKSDLAVSSVLREGDPTLEIVNAAKEGGFDVIVVGHRGLGKVKELFLGGISEKVVHLASCPVIIIKYFGFFRQFRNI
jgi:nucleotide-binding universal stress UspA family protein